MAALCFAPAAWDLSTDSPIFPRSMDLEHALQSAFSESPFDTCSQFAYAGLSTHDGLNLQLPGTAIDGP